MSTAKVAEPISGDKLYQKRAREAFPILVRQALAGTPIFYSELAQELGMSNPRNLNYVLASIGQTIEKLSKSWNTKVPAIQCLVINKAKELPGDGFGWFLSDYSKLSRKQLRDLLQIELQNVFAFPRWPEVLKVLNISPVEIDFSSIVKKASNFVGGGGEGSQHRALKEYVASHPEVVGLAKNTPAGQTEAPLPSGDALDVSFDLQKDWIAVEVKSAISDDADITRGLFQCIKYRAVMDAVQRSRGLPQNSRAVLVLEGSFPGQLVGLKNILGIEVIDNVNPEKG